MACLRSVYTGVRPEVVMIATSDNEMIRWTKFTGNPVISRPPGGAKVVGFRDPCVWKENDGWYMIVGTGIKGESGGALLFQSPDLRKWHYLDPLFTGKVKEKDEAGLVAQSDMWECPDFFPLFGKHALIVSTKGKSPYFIGKYTGHKFYPETEGHNRLRRGLCRENYDGCKRAPYLLVVDSGAARQGCLHRGRMVRRHEPATLVDAARGFDAGDRTAAGAENAARRQGPDSQHRFTSGKG